MVKYQCTQQILSPQIEQNQHIWGILTSLTIQRAAKQVAWEPMTVYNTAKHVVELNIVFICVGLRLVGSFTCKKSPSEFFRVTLSNSFQKLKCSNKFAK